MQKHIVNISLPQKEGAIVMNDLPLPPKLSGGFTLIEVLVSLVIVAVGLLGIAALQYRGVIAVNDAYQRSQAATFLLEVADMLRTVPAADRGAVVSGLDAFTVDDAWKKSAGRCLNTITGNQVTNCIRQRFANEFPITSTLNLTQTQVINLQGTGVGPVLTHYKAKVEWQDRQGAIDNNGGAQTTGTVKRVTEYDFTILQQ